MAAVSNRPLWDGRRAG